MLFSIGPINKNVYVALSHIIVHYIILVMLL